MGDTDAEAAAACQVGEAGGDTAGGAATEAEAPEEQNYASAAGEAAASGRGALLDISNRCVAGERSFQSLACGRQYGSLRLPRFGKS